MYDVTAR